MTTRLIEELIFQTASNENLSLDEFIEDLKRNPDDWYAFRREELAQFITNILLEVSKLTDTGAGPDFDHLLVHFGLKSIASEPEA